MIGGVVPQFTLQPADLLGVPMDPATHNPRGLAVYARGSAASGFALQGDVEFGPASADTLAISVMDRQHVVAVVDQSGPNAVLTFASSDGGAHFRRIIAAPRQPSSISVDSAMQFASVCFVDIDNGWTFATFSTWLSESFVGRANGCHSKNLLYATHDGGTTWLPLAPP